MRNGWGEELFNDKDKDNVETVQREWEWNRVIDSADKKGQLDLF